MKILYITVFLLFFLFINHNVKAQTCACVPEKTTCGSMVSCAEANHYLTVCGVISLDGDRDGTPCNATGLVCDGVAP